MVDIDSKDDIVTQPNSDAKTFGWLTPIWTFVEYLDIIMGRFGGNGVRAFGPLTEGKPLPCWYGPCVSKLGPVIGVVNVLPFGMEVKRSTPPVQPLAGHDGHKPREPIQKKKIIILDQNSTIIIDN